MLHTPTDVIIRRESDSLTLACNLQFSWSLNNIIIRNFFSRSNSTLNRPKCWSQIPQSFYLYDELTFSLAGRYSTISYVNLILLFSAWIGGAYKTMQSSRCNTLWLAMASILFSTTLPAGVSPVRRFLRAANGRAKEENVNNWIERDSRWTNTMTRLLQKTEKHNKLHVVNIDVELRELRDSVDDSLHKFWELRMTCRSQKYLQHFLWSTYPSSDQMTEYNGKQKSEKSSYRQDFFSLDTFFSCFSHPWPAMTRIRSW